MSDKRMRLRQRRQSYRRLHGEKKAVSPVVATLILILIAVAAAAALYLWLVVWQGSLTSGIGNPHAQATVTIGGSTSVYPFSSLAATWFEQNQSDVVVSDNQGGTGAGMLAVCAGNVDVGAASSLETAATLEASDGCPSLTTITVTTIAYDAVDVIVPAANLHALVSVSYDTLTAIYDGSTTANAGTPTLVPSTIDTVTDASGILDVAPWSTHAALDWDQIPACVLATTNCGGTGNPTEALATSVVAPTATAGAACAAGTDVCAAAGASPCGFTVCAGPFTAVGSVAQNDPIVTYARTEASGTTQTFEARVLGATSATAFASSFAGLGFSGCGSNNLISDCGLIADKTGQGNPNVISGVAGNPDAIGYASDGLARVPGSGVSCQGVATAACGIGLEYPGGSVAVQPSLGSSGSIAGGVVNGGFGTPGLTTTVTVAASYAGARPFEFVTLQAPSGVVAEFFTFITDPANNIALAGATGEVSIYSI